MLIELESVYGDKLIHGGHLEREELQNAIKEINIYELLEIVFCSQR